MPLKPELAKKRILAFDQVRGFFLLAIMVNHLPLSFFALFTGAGRLPASVAEGFFLISGLMVGYIYGPKILITTKKVFKKIWKRAGLLYVLCVSFTLLYTAWALQDPDNPKYTTLYSKNDISYIYNTFLLRYSFGWADFLSRYAWFMFLAPFALWLIAKRKAWLVIAASVIVWFLLRTTELFLPFSAWQLVFVIGIVIGYYFNDIQNWFNSRSATIQRSLYSFFTYTTLITLLASVFLFVYVPMFGVSFSSGAWASIMQFQQTIISLTDKDTLAPLRVAIGAFWFIGLFMFVQKHENRIEKTTRGFLTTLGQNSLLVYCLHAFVIFVIDLYVAPVRENVSFIFASLLVILTVAIVYTSTKFVILLRNEPPRTRSQTNP